MYIWYAKKNDMSKIEQLFHGNKIIVDKFTENGGIPYAETYRISVFNQWNNYHDELTLTEDQWAELKRFMLDGTDGVIAKPFTDDEIDTQFRPRFGGANPKYRDFYRSAWNAAFEYVNDKLLKGESNHEWRSF